MLREREFISKVESLWNRHSHYLSNILIPIGDDAAVVDDFVLSTDSIVEKAHFLREFADKVGEERFYKSLGFKVVSVSVSDIVAMGCYPEFLLISVGFPDGFPDEFVEFITSGIDKAVNFYGVVPVGGDTTSSPFLFLNSVVVGKKKNSVWVRSGARLGDNIYITGHIGLSGVGLRALMGKMVGEIENEILEMSVSRFLEPVARVKVVEFLHRFEITSAIDLSDGIVAGLMEISRRSRKKLVVNEDSLPLPPLKLAKQIALISGEDYELLFTSPDEIDSREFLNNTGVNLSKVGIVEESVNGEVVFVRDGKEIPIDESMAFEHAW